MLVLGCANGTQHRILAATDKTPRRQVDSEAVADYEKMTVKFAEAASTANKNLLMTYMSPINQNQTKELPAILDRVIAYFSDYKKIGSCAKAEPTRDEFGNVGYIYFRESITNNDQRKPFKIIILRKNGQPYVTNITQEKHRSGNFCFT